MKDQSSKIKYLSSLIFKPPSIPQCSRHPQFLKPTNLICIKSSCNSYMSLFCNECQHPQTHLYQIQKIIPVLAQQLQNKWQQSVRKQNGEIERQWKNCQINLGYCIDILNQIRNIVIDSQSNRLNQLPIFQHIIDLVLDMYKQGVTVTELTRNLEILNHKYGVFQINKKKEDKFDRDTKINSDSIDRDIQFRKQKWFKMGQQTKKFSQKALSFSETLAKTIENKLKFQKRKQHLNQLTTNKASSLFQLLQLYQNAKDDLSFSEKMQELSFLKIQLPSSNSSTSKPKKCKLQQQQNYLQKNFQKCKNLTSLLINNKNGNISLKIWQILISKFEYLKKLTQLRLHLKQEQQLLLLIKLIKDRPHSVRHISVLYLIITDRPKINLKQIAEFCNCFELRQLYLTLTRNNITKTNLLQFLNLLRIKTSLSYLPMNILSLNISKNKIGKIEDEKQCQMQFMIKCKEIKKKNIKL